MSIRIATADMSASRQPTKTLDGHGDQPAHAPIGILDALPYLVPRCKMMLARATLGIDRKRSKAFAEAAFSEVVDLTHARADCNSAASPPWPIRDEPSLIVAFKETLGLLSRQQAAASRWMAAAAGRESARRVRSVASELETGTTPSAAEMLSSLERGTTLQLEGHTLTWNEEFECLEGTNACGIEYLWDSMSLRSVAAWRARVLSGRGVGPRPRTPAADEKIRGGETAFEAEADEASALWRELESLRRAGGWCFDARLRLVEQCHRAPAEPLSVD